MKYAVIRSSGGQYLVCEGDVLALPKLGQAEGKVDFLEVLLVKIDDKVMVGQPLVNGAKVSGQIVRNYRGKKIDVLKFKAKSRYRVKTGFRADLTDVKIEAISL